MTGPVVLDDGERRRRLVHRHHLGIPARSLVGFVRDLIAVHSSDPLTPYLAARARLPGFDVETLERALYRERTLWRLHAMRRTLFVTAVEDAPMLAAAAGDTVAARERTRLAGWLAPVVGEDAVEQFLADVGRRALERLSEEGELRTTELRAAVPELDTALEVGSGRWATTVPLASRLLYVLALERRIVRGAPAGSWRSSQYRWAETRSWFGDVPPDIEAAAARAELARRYLAVHGPATEVDLRWWTGWTARQTAAALAATATETVTTGSGRPGLILAGDAEATPEAETAVALAPGLDPTAMAWKEREWYVGDRVDALFDRNGNAGPTVWVDGAMVGAWAQRPDGEVVHRLLVDVGSEAERAVDVHAARLGEWLDGDVVTPRFRTPLERELVG